MTVLHSLWPQGPTQQIYSGTGDCHWPTSTEELGEDALEGTSDASVGVALACVVSAAAGVGLIDGLAVVSGAGFVGATTGASLSPSPKSPE